MSSAATRKVSRRIYGLSPEAIQFHKAMPPLAGALESLDGGEARGVDPELRGALRGVRDHVLRTTEQIEGFRYRNFCSSGGTNHTESG